MTINLSFLLSPLNSPSKYHTCKPQLISQSFNLMSLNAVQNGVSLVLVFLLNFPKYPTKYQNVSHAIYRHHYTNFLSNAISVSSLILHSQCPITFPQFLNLVFYPSVTSTKYSWLHHCAHYLHISRTLKTWLLQLPVLNLPQGWREGGRVKQERRSKFSYA